MRQIAVLGAGDLIAHLSRMPDDSYHFEIRREGGEDDPHQLRPSDLKDFIKLGELIAFAVLDDGWSSPQERRDVIALFKQLEEVSTQ